MKENNLLRQVVLVVALANLAYFLVEFFAALHIQSVALLADSIDFLEDASVNLLIFFALAWTVQQRARAGMFMAALIMIPAITTLVAVWQKITGQHPPLAAGMSLVGFGALLVNFSCAALLAKFRNQQGSLTKAAFLSARNDAFANITIIGTGFITMAYPSAWPDIVVGLAIAAMNADAAKEVFETARTEYRQASA